MLSILWSIGAWAVNTWSNGAWEKYQSTSESTKRFLSVPYESRKVSSFAHISTAQVLEELRVDIVNLENRVHHILVELRILYATKNKQGKGMLTLFTKDPAATLDYSVDWTDFLEDAETIATSVWTAPEGLTVLETTKTTKKATIWLSGGTLGEKYEVVNRMTSSNTTPRIDERTIIVHIVNK